MKTSLPLAISLCVILFACNASSDRYIQNIEGTYTRSFNTENNKGVDSIFVTASGIDENTFLMTVHTSFNRIIDGQVSPLQHSVHKMYGVFEPKKKQLYEQHLGRLYSFNKDFTELSIGASKYTKVNGK